MRLISQDGMFDVPYENVCISINCRNKNQIIAWNFGCEDCEIVSMAIYSTEPKALKVMEMLREEYLETVYDYRTRPKVFQFPKDEEVEV